MEIVTGLDENKNENRGIELRHKQKPKKNRISLPGNL